MPALLPVFLDLVGRDCLVVGGGSIAERRVLSLLDCQARVTVVSPTLTDALRERVAGDLQFLERAYLSSDLDGRFLAIAATNDPSLNATIVAEARARQILTGAVDRASAADFSAGSVIRRDDLTVAISTGRRSPAFNRWLREDIEEFLTSEYLGLLTLVAELRAEIQATSGVTADDRLTRWREVPRDELLALVRRGKVAEARERLRALLLGAAVPG